jgi:hypothetical protein
LAEEACITVDLPALLGAVECDHSENHLFGPSLGYPQLASQLLYAGTVSRILPSLEDMKRRNESSCRY